MVYPPQRFPSILLCLLSPKEEGWLRVVCLSYTQCLHSTGLNWTKWNEFTSCLGRYDKLSVYQGLQKAALGLDNWEMAAAAPVNKISCGFCNISLNILFSKNPKEKLLELRGGEMMGNEFYDTLPTLKSYLQKIESFVMFPSHSNSCLLLC